MKRCSKCGENKPRSQFNVARQNRDGRSSWCRACYSEYNGAKADAKRRARQAALPRRHCIECGAELAITKRGDARFCSERCRSRRGGREWARKMAPVARADRIAVKAKTPRVCRECGNSIDPARPAHALYCSPTCARRYLGRQWARANPEKTHATLARRIARDPEAYRQSTRLRSARWRAVNRDVLRSRESARRAAKRGVAVEFVHSLVVLEHDDGMCGICGLDVDPLNFHVDHVIPLSQGGEHSYANTQTAHPRCNILKKDSLPWEGDTA